MFKHILIPTDGSELSAKAIHHGVDLAKVLGAKVTAFIVIEPMTTGGRVVMSDGFRESYEKETNQRAHDALGVAMKAALAAGVPVSTAQAFDFHPDESINRVAQDKGCDLIVMASHGWKGVKGVVLGSQTTKVLSHSKIPVLVVR
jgi:nucleotide-binding universal stress UspA family protein